MPGIIILKYPCTMKWIVLLIFFFTSFIAEGQPVYRIKGEYSLKSKDDAHSQLVMGEFFYDLNEGQIIYRNHFPEKEVWVTDDTALYRIVNEEVVSSQTIPDLSEFSIFHLALTHNLKNFGIDDENFQLENVEQDNNMVISTYQPIGRFKDLTGKILLSMTEGKLFGMVFFSRTGEIVKKQFFEDYYITGGIPFPGKITEITYKEGKESYRVTTYRNIKYNSREPQDFYHFDADLYFSNSQRPGN